MPRDRFKKFLGRVTGDPFANISIDRGKVKVKDLHFQHEITIDPDCFFSYRIYLNKFDTMYINVDVLEGEEIDLLITNEYNFERYKKGEQFIYIVSGSILKMKKISNIFIAQDEGMYHIILDNTYYPENGARPNLNINKGIVRIALLAKTHMPIQMDAEKPLHLR